MSPDPEGAIQGEVSMQIKFNFKSFDPSDHLKSYARGRFEKLSRYVRNMDAAELQVNLEVEKLRQMAEVVLVDDDTHLSASEESQDMYATIDLVLDKIEAQLRKIRDKDKDHRRGGRTGSVRMDVISFTEGDAGRPQRNIVTTDRYEPKPMTVEEAAMQLETTNLDFLVFKNAESDGVNVIYRRKNGDFGLIDPGV